MTQEDRLMQEYKNGDPSALDKLVELYYPEIFRYCRLHTGSREQAEDAAQDTFLKAVRFLERYRHKGTFRAFLYKVALNTCIDLGRKRTEEPWETLPEEIAGESGCARVESEIDFERMLACLSHRQRELVVLKYAQGLTLREIAAITDSNLRTVQSNLRKALQLLKETLERDGEFP